MIRSIAALAWLICADWLASYAAAVPFPSTNNGPRIHTVHVVSNGWHTAIVVSRAALVATDLLPEADDFPGATFIEFSWGDRAYYPAEEKTLGMTLRAALTPTPAVMHVAGLARAPELIYANSDVVAMALTERGFRQLVGAIADEFERPGRGRAEPTSRGLYPDSHFYNAHGTFHLFNTCNTWTARMLLSGGVTLSPSAVITADQLLARLRSALTSLHRVAA